MSDPRTYQRTGAYCSWWAMDQQDSEGQLDDLEQEVADREADEWEGLADAPY